MHWCSRIHNVFSFPTSLQLWKAKADTKPPKTRRTWPCSHPIFLAWCTLLLPNPMLLYGPHGSFAHVSSCVRCSNFGAQKLWSWGCSGRITPTDGPFFLAFSCNVTRLACSENAPWTSRIFGPSAILVYLSVVQCLRYTTPLVDVLCWGSSHPSWFFCSVVFVRGVAQSVCSKQTRMRHEKRGRNQNMPHLRHDCYWMRNVIMSLREDGLVSHRIDEHVRMVARSRRERMIAHDFTDTCFCCP